MTRTKRSALDRAALLTASVLALAFAHEARADNTAPAAKACVAGAWSPAASPAMPPVRYETEHFAFRWKGDDATLEAARTAGVHLEHVWRVYMVDVGFREPDCDRAAKTKVNIHLDPTFGLTGGYDDAGDPAMWISAPALLDHWGLAHEFAHALQGSSGGLRDSPYVGWVWESHANWMTHQLPEFRGEVHCSELQVNFPHLYYGSTRQRYCNWQFWEYLKDKAGYGAINDLWTRSPRAGDPGLLEADPFSILMANQGWTLEQLNDLFGEWALHNVNWDYIDPDGRDQGAVYRKAYGGYQPQGRDRLLRTTVLDPIDKVERRFVVPDGWAPQRWGYNIVQLIPDAGAKQVSVGFQGVVQSASAAASLPGGPAEPKTITPPASGWRWGLVVIDRDGKARYGALQSGTKGQAVLPLHDGDQSVWLVVSAAPTVMQKIQWDQPYYSIYRYPWTVQVQGAWPGGAQPDAPPPVAGAHRHPNGGGWVAPGAQVDAGAYVGPYARVLSGAVRGQARIEDHAVVDGGQVLDNATAAGLTIVKRGAVLRGHARAATTFMGLGAFEPGVDLSGDAQNIGDVEQRGAALSHGVYYGFIDPETARAPLNGAERATPVPEITATAKTLKTLP